MQAHSGLFTTGIAGYNYQFLFEPDFFAWNVRLRITWVVAAQAQDYQNLGDRLILLQRSFLIKEAPLSWDEGYKGYILSQQTFPGTVCKSGTNSTVSRLACCAAGYDVSNIKFEVHFQIKIRRTPDGWCFLVSSRNNANAFVTSITSSSMSQ